ncbi:MAG: hypothetical protein ACFNXU_04075 [Kingella sp. (in: b-proteobacteria)]
MVFLLGLSAVFQAAANNTYVCEERGQTIYATRPINSKCKMLPARASSVASELSPNEASSTNIGVTQIINDEIAQVWGNTKYDIDDVVIIASEPEIISNPVTQNSPKTININLRQQPKIVPKNEIAQVVNIPPKPPVLTRRQILQQEIDREQMAVQKIKTQLIMAHKNNNISQIQKLTVQMSDRLQNINALQAEMRR